MKTLKVYLFIDICFTMQKYFLFLFFGALYHFFSIILQSKVKIQDESRY